MGFYIDNVKVHNWTDTIIDDDGNETHANDQQQHVYPGVDMSETYHVYGLV